MPYRRAFSTLGLKVAFRYFTGKKSAQAVNIISWISITAIVISTAAMVILLSVENGFDGLLKTLYNVFYPEIKITAKEGKFFALTPSQISQLKLVKGIGNVSFSIEDMVMLQSNDEQRFATVKGIDDNWMRASGIDSYIVEGNKSFAGEQQNFIPGVIGINIAGVLGINVQNPFAVVDVYYPNPSAANTMIDPANAFNHIAVKPQAVFKVQADFDGKYVLVPLNKAQQLFGAEGKISSVEIALTPGISDKKMQKQLQHLLGESLNIATRYEQNKTLWMILGSEKWAIYVILFFVLLLSSFNMIGVLSLMVIEKKKDISILKSMGATTRQVRAIFLHQGLIMACTGGLAGIFLGVLICLGQQYFGWVKMGNGGFIIDTYPVALRGYDMLLVMATVLLIGILASWQPARKAAMQKISVREE